MAQGVRMGRGAVWPGSHGAGQRARMARVSRRGPDVVQAWV